MAAIFAANIFKCIFPNENDNNNNNNNNKISIKIAWQFVPRSPIDNTTALGSGNGLAPNGRQAIVWTNADLVQFRIYAALGRDGLRHWAVMSNERQGVWNYCHCIQQSVHTNKKHTIRISVRGSHWSPMDRFTKGQLCGKRPCHASLWEHHLKWKYFFYHNAKPCSSLRSSQDVHILV